MGRSPARERLGTSPASVSPTKEFLGLSKQDWAAGAQKGGGRPAPRACGGQWVWPVCPQRATGAVGARRQPQQDGTVR